jgi:hypothetical protein
MSENEAFDHGGVIVINDQSSVAIINAKILHLPVSIILGMLVVSDLLHSFAYFFEFPIQFLKGFFIVDRLGRGCFGFFVCLGSILPFAPLVLQLSDDMVENPRLLAY